MADPEPQYITQTLPSRPTLLTYPRCRIRSGASRSVTTPGIGRSSPFQLPRVTATWSSGASATTACSVARPRHPSATPPATPSTRSVAVTHPEREEERGRGGEEETEDSGFVSSS